MQQFHLTVHRKNVFFSFSGSGCIIIVRQHTEAPVSTLTRDIDIAILSVCLSIHPSVRCIPVFYRNDSTYCLVSSPHDCPVILILWVSNIFAKFWRGHTLRGAKYRSDIKKFTIFTNKSLYLANDTRQRYSYYRRRMGNQTAPELSNGTSFNDLEWPLT